MRGFQPSIGSTRKQSKLKGTGDRSPRVSQDVRGGRRAVELSFMLPIAWRVSGRAVSESVVGVSMV